MNSISHNPNALDGIFPDGRLAFLVRAALGRDDAAALWRAYLSALGDEFPNEGETRLYPLVAQFVDFGDTPKRISTIADSLEKWARARSMISRNFRREVEAKFNENAIQVLWTKGNALCQTVYESDHLRVTHDLDAIVQWSEIDAIQKLAKDQGWEQHIALVKSSSRSRFISEELSFNLSPMCTLDMAWGPRSVFAFDPFLSDWVWQDSHKTGNKNAPSTWLLIEAIEHGLSANTVYPIRWLVDAVMILENCDDVDWDLLQVVIDRYQLQYLFQVAFMTLQKFTDAIPADRLAHILSYAPTRIDKEELAARLTSENLAEAWYAARLFNMLRRSSDIQFATSMPIIPRHTKSLSLLSKLEMFKRIIETKFFYPFYRLSRMR